MSRNRRRSFVVTIEERTQREFDLGEAREMYEAGASLDAIGDEFGVSHNTVARRLRAGGVRMRRPGRKES